MENEKVTEIPSHEDPFERLTDIGKEVADITSDFREQSIKKVMLDQALSKLSDEEYYLITQLSLSKKSTQKGGLFLINIENGEIVEEGTHDELMALGGKYAYMYKVQSKYYKEGDENE